MPTGKELKEKVAAQDPQASWGAEDDALASSLPKVSADGEIDLDSALEGEARGWNPEPGDKVVGRILFVSTCDCGGFGSHPLVEITTDDGEVIDVHGFHAVLANALRRWAPQAGQRIGIKYVGRVTEGGEFGGYENYRVIVAR